MLAGKTVLITGGTGSFGHTFIEVLLQSEAEKIIIFSRDECKQWEMRRRFDDPRLRYFLGDVRDPQRLRRAFADVDIVIHAAALKQVDTAEYNPSEYVLTNVMGAMHIIDAAIDAGVERVIALSTDKAVNPANLYGATKLCSDRLFVAAKSYVGKRGMPLFSVVRYGNVLGSRGSVIQSWQELIDGGATSLPITDTRMTRFWITLNQAAQFVLQVLGVMEGGEIFVPKIPSMRLVDLAEAMLPGAELDVQGIRAGEKLHELLISSEEGMRTSDRGDAYVVYPEPVGEGVPEYGSDTNDRWLKVDDLRTVVA
jgi:UDP-N-acetylglucosamine 4,6-dehydratase/5-epimerase